MVVQTFSKWCLIAEFRIERDYIAKNLCVNRLNPCCCCKGKCYLNKKLAEDESRQQTPGKDAQHEEIPLQVLPTGKLVPDPVVTYVHAGTAARYLNRKSQEYIPSFFAPPREDEVL
jgi:hypothetical protein